MKLTTKSVLNQFSHFQHAEESIRKKIYNEKVLKKNGNDNFMSLEEGVQRIRKGLFAFHMERALGYKLMSETFFEDEKCGIIEIAYLQGTLFIAHYSITCNGQVTVYFFTVSCIVTSPWYAIRKNSSFQELFKIG